MSKSRVIILVLTGLVITAVIAGYIYKSYQDNHLGIITIKNQSATPIFDASIEYRNRGKIDELGVIDAHASVTYHIIYTDTEDSISLHYKDKQKQPHTVLVVPYAAKYDKENYEVVID